MVTLRTGEPCSGVIMGVEDPAGELRWISIASEPLRHSLDAPPYAVVATITYATDSPRAREQLSQSERRYRLLFENLREDVTVFELVRNDEGHIVDWLLRDSNRQARRFFGEQYPAALGRRITDLVGKDEMRPHIEKTEAILRGEVEPKERYIGMTDRYCWSTLFALD